MYGRCDLQQTQPQTASTLTDQSLKSLLSIALNMCCYTTNAHGIALRTDGHRT